MMRALALAPLALLAAACSSEPVEEEGDAVPVDVATPTPEPAPDHRYTRLADCTLLRSAPEEAGFYEHECAGLAGYRLVKVEADLRDNVIVIAPDGGRHNLGLPALANGAFSSLGDMVEWRGFEVAGDSPPQSLILRQSVMEDPDPGRPEASYLLAVSLAGTPCVVARLPAGPDQNAQARAAADRGGACLGR